MQVIITTLKFYLLLKSVPLKCIQESPPFEKYCVSAIGSLRIQVYSVVCNPSRSFVINSGMFRSS